MPNAAAGGKGAKGGNAGGGKGGGGSNGAIGSGGGVRVGGSTESRPGDWQCHLCGVPANRSWRSKCRNCEAYRSKDMERAIAAARDPSLAERQTQQQRQQKAKDDAERRKLRQENERLSAELAAAKARGPSTAAEADADIDFDDLDDSDCYASWTEEERSKRLELARGGLAYAVERHGEGSSEAVALRDEISAIQRASREAKPFKAHRDQLERRRERLRRQQERDEEEVKKTHAEIAELQAKAEGLQKAIEERARSLKEVNAELNELVRKALEEGSGGEGSSQTACGQEQSPWTNVSNAIKALAAQPGIPADFAALLAHVQEAAAVMSAAAARSAAQQGAAPVAATGGQAPPAGQQAAPQPSTTTSSIASPIVLAPHGRFAKAAGKPPHSPPQAPTPAAVHAETTGGSSSGGATGGCVPQPATPVGGGASGDQAEAGAGAAATPAAAADCGAEQELLADPGDGDAAVAMDIEQSLAKLPEQDQRKLRAALGRRGGLVNRKPEGQTSRDEEGSRRGERERSPRPTKAAEEAL